MTSISLSSPHLTSPGNASGPMRQVLLALVPGLLVLTWQFGWGSLINVLFASLCALVLEAASLKLRGRPVSFYLRDGSALVTGVLLGLALPPLMPWWITLTGIFFAIVIAKQFYGGLGYNPFNPAMVGYVVLLISYPLEMTNWPTPLSMLNEHPASMDFIPSLQRVFLSESSTQIDGYTMATALDVLKQNQTLPLAQLKNNELAFGHLGSSGWEWVNLAYLLGGLYLLIRRVFTWHAPIAMLSSLVLLSALCYQGGSAESSGSPLFHLFSGATMLGAFFIVTDPVTSAASNQGRLIYGACIGALVFIIRTWGNYPDAMAFSVLLMNFAAPLIDHYVKPRQFGGPGFLSALLRRGKQP